MLAPPDVGVPTAPKLSAAVNAAFTSPPVEVFTGVASKARKGYGRDRSAVIEATVGGHPLTLAMVAEGLGDTSSVDWCQMNLLPLVVRFAGDDPSAASLQKAGFQAFHEAHRVATSGGPARGGFTVTLCVLNRLRNEVITWNLGAAAAVFFGTKGGVQTLTKDHRIDICDSEQERLRGMGVQLAHAQNAQGAPMGPLRAWPGAITCARVIGAVGTEGVVEGLLSPRPSCSTFALATGGTGDLLICSDGVWDELLLSAVGGLTRSCPTAASAARHIVHSAASQHLAYDQQGFGNPRDDITCIVVRIG